MKKIIKEIISNRRIREFFKLSWNPFYEYTFHDIANTIDESIKKIDKNKKFNSYTETLNYLNKEITHIKDFKIEDSEIHSFVPILISCLNSLENRKINSILDIGGGVNPISFYIKDYCNQEIRSSIIETENYANKLNEISKKYNYINYYSDINQIKNESFDLIYFGSSLQYFEDRAYEMLDKSLKFNPKFIIFTRNFFIPGNEDIYSLQSCGRFHLIPHKFFSISKFINYFNENNFDLIFQAKHENFYKHKKLDKNNFDFKSLIFKKKY